MIRPDRHTARCLAIIIIAAFMLVPGIVAAPAVSAQEAQVKLGIEPVDSDGNYFDLTLESGEARDLSVRLTNHGEAVISTRTYPADVYTIVNGGLGARLAGEPTSDTTHWIDYRDETLDLESGETVTRMFTLNVPADTEPGQYITSLVIQNAEPVGGNSGDSIGFNQVNRQVIAIAIRIPGPDDPELQIGQASHRMVASKSVVRIEVINPGNVHLVPHGEFTLTNSQGIEVARVPVKMLIVYSGTDTLLDASLPTLLEAGDYVATLMLQEDKYGLRVESGPLPLSIPELVAPQPAAATEDEDEDEDRTVIETQIVGIPTWVLLIAIPLAILAGAVLAFLALKRRMQQTMLAAGVAQPQVAVQQSTTPDSKPVNVRKMTPPTRGPNTNHENNEE